MSPAPGIPKSVRSRFNSLDLSNTYSIVNSARKGIKTKVFYDFADSAKMPEKNLAVLLNLSSRTVANYKAQQKPLEPVQSEHLLKLIALFAKGEEIFGNVDEFNYWLQRPFWKTEESPIGWLITPGGVDLVTNEVDRLAHGYPA